MTEESNFTQNVPTGFLPTEEMKRMMEEQPGAHLEAVAYDCTGERVGSVFEAHTIVVRIFKGKDLLYETQIAGSPCGV